MELRTRSESVVLRGSRVEVGGRRSKRYQTGRTCDSEGCGTVLSVYNANNFCWQHERPRRSMLVERGLHARTLAKPTAT